MAFELQTTLRDLKNRDWMKRMEAIRQLEVAHEDSVVADIAGMLLADDSPYVRAAAARTLGRLGSAEAVDALIQALNDEAFHVRQAAMWALGEIGGAAQPALEALRPFTESVERFSQAELTVAEIAGLVVERIEGALAEETEARAAAESDTPKIVLSPIDLMAAKKKGMTPEAYAAEKYGDAPAHAPARKAPAPPVEAPAAEAASADKPKVTLSPMDLMAAKKKGMTPEAYAAEKYGDAPAPAPVKKAAAPAAETATGEPAPAGEKKAMSPADMMKAKKGDGEPAPPAEKKALSPAEMMKAKKGGGDAPAPAEKKAEASDAPAGEKKAMSPAEMFKKKKDD